MINNKIRLSAASFYLPLFIHAGRGSRASQEELRRKMGKKNTQKKIENRDRRGFKPSGKSNEWLTR